MHRKPTTISIHALLAESDPHCYQQAPYFFYFYPRSPCGERLEIGPNLIDGVYFYPRSPCGERPRLHCIIHTLPVVYFYPRSPCGERQLYINRTAKTVIFLSTLSLRRATNGHVQYCIRARISIHALLAESDIILIALSIQPTRFLSTLSLRRATVFRFAWLAPGAYFYPRSPCGERPGKNLINSVRGIISIHALLAESDKRQPGYMDLIHYFYPRSPCGERQW